MINIFNDFGNTNVGVQLPQVFENPEFGPVRVVMNENGDPLFCLKDVASCLGYASPSDAIRDRCDDGSVNHRPIQDSLGRTQQAKFGPESEVYRLIFGSKLDSAKKFQDWVFQEVLPSIRKNGSYSVQSRIPQTYAEALRAAAELAEQKERLALENAVQKAKIEQDKPKIDAYEDMLAIDGYCNFCNAAKTIFGTYSQKGRNQLFRYCREQGYLMEKSTEPYQKFIDCGFFKVIQTRKYNPKLKRFISYPVTLISVTLLSRIHKEIRQKLIDKNILFDL